MLTVSGRWRQVMYTCIVYTTYTMLGVTRGFINYSVKQLENDSELRITDEQLSWIGSLCVFPNPFGSIVMGILMNKIGRKKSLIIATMLFCLGWILVASTTQINILYLSFILIGFSVGMCLCSSVYVVEICERHNRSLCLSLFVIFFTFGISYSYVITSILGWRESAWTFAATFLAVLFLLHSIPESPHWYIKNDDKVNAIKSIRMLYTSDRTKLTEAEAQTEYENMVFNIAKPVKSYNSSFSKLSSNWRQLSIILTFQFILQSSGYCIMLSYCRIIFERVYTNSDHIQAITLGYSYITFSSSFCVPLAASVLGRKSMIKFSSLGMSLSLMVVLGCMQFGIRDTLVIPVCFYVYTFVCSVGALTISESLPSEIFTIEARGLMCGIAQAFSTIISGIYMKVFPLLFVDVAPEYTVLTFTLFSIAMLCFGIFVLPETKDKSLEEIQKEYFQK